MMKWKKYWTDRLTGIVIAAPIVAAALIDSFFSVVFAKDSEDVREAERMYPRAALVDSVSLRIDFAVDSLCRITDPSHSLDAFMDELEALLSGKDTVVNVVHLGDSHVQAGFYSGQVMHMLQEAFGNAGRGWISPLKLAKVNEPKDYFITSNIKDWEVGRCIQKNPPCPLGPGAMGIRTLSEQIDFSVCISPVSGAGYAFRQMVLYRDSEAAPMLPVHGDTIPFDICWGSEAEAPGVVTDTFRVAEEIDGVQLLAAPREIPADRQTKKNASCYYGFSLANGRPGILYHAVGQNGAMFVNYSRPEYIRRLALLKPSLLIVTLGTNEAFAPESRFSSEQLVMQMDSFVRTVKDCMPGTAILITTPAESFRRVRKRQYVQNRNIHKAATTIRDYAEKEGIACFDLYGATGGNNSCKKWEKANLIGRDRVHYSVDGYYEQGKLLYRALVRLKLNQQNEMHGDD
ncbi:MAG: GDSL-type esterase/lipase family protein [Tannerella sp.]|jgi:lysophospholipase L1-like esterase|nr:GDSL-type esterase/lipase family protein [Tannerella sp.]